MQVLLVGDSDVGKQEILAGLEDGAVEAPYASSTGAGKKLYGLSCHYDLSLSLQNDHHSD